MALRGLKVIEFAGLAPAPFAGLILADNGASVVRIDRPGSISVDVLCRGKRSICVNLKVSSGRDLLRRLIANADVLIEPFRPGVMERLGLGPDVFLAEDGLNKKLIYARVIGFPRAGPHNGMAGHDINYLAVAGILSMFPGPEKPTFPLNILADFAGGGLTSALGILLALGERSKSGLGQVVDTDMVSGARYLSTFPFMHQQYGTSAEERGANMLDGGYPFYDVYCCKEGGWMSVGCLEPQFFREFLRVFAKSLPEGFSVHQGWTPTPEMQMEVEEYPKLKDYITQGFLTNTRDYWTQAFHGTDACVLPVMTPDEARRAHPSNSEFPAPHPTVSSQFRVQHPLAERFLQPGTHTEEVLKELGFADDDLNVLQSEGAISIYARSRL